VPGFLYVDLGLYPGTPADLQAAGTAPYPEIPTLPTMLEEAQAKATAFLSKLNEVDVEGLVEEVKAAVKRVNELASSPDLKKSLAELPPAIQEVGDAAAQLHRTFGKFEGVSGNADQALVATRD